MRFAGLIPEHHSGRVARPREGIVEFSRQERAVFQRLNKIGDAPAVVYDIGASNGCWSVVVSDSLPPAEHHLFGPLCDHLIYSDILQRAAAIIPNRTCIGLGFLIAMHLYDADRGGQISTLRRARSSISATPRGLQRTIE